ncbi:uncharacterized protein F4812DRAFT_457157 [Daldinia caldariorum]|uniref:uncharacterized protein n=1 Tax=Daldinia caldariorum TaxID=326644 RepID=UPI0020077F0E|nr:uncharacterized protein F4812DRAFT_457157 [Daldinia caldariorum]KAI1469756.1 hypothetical protein F4812DRAFT_457157 [Daldinia caldariorum]
MNTTTLPGLGPRPRPGTIPSISPDVGVGVMFKDVQVHCPNDSTQKACDTCYDDNAPYNCDNKPGPDRKMCKQLWMIWCGQGAGCEATDSRAPSKAADIRGRRQRLRFYILVVVHQENDMSGPMSTKNYL